MHQRSVAIDWRRSMAHPGGRYLLYENDEPGHMPVVKTDDVLGGDPRLEGRRVSVLHVAELVRTGYSPAYVADQFALSLAEVHEAMAYYYDNPDEMDALRERDAEVEEELRDRSNAPTKPA